ncbi:hypothetical protein EBR25_03660 [bacterium]|nr:hypothetical protein [bacterium]
MRQGRTLSLIAQFSLFGFLLLIHLMAMHPLGSFSVADEVNVRECRIIDERGLTLAVERGIQEIFTITLEFSKNSDVQGNIVLMDLSGAGDTRRATIQESGRIVFPNIEPGSWQLSQRPTGLQLLSVRID